MLRTQVATEKSFINLFAYSFGQSIDIHPLPAGAGAVLVGYSKTDLGPALLELPF